MKDGRGTVAKSAPTEQVNEGGGSKNAERALYLLVFICGGVLMGIEIAGSRILAPGFGTSLFVWGSIIGLVMGAMACGYWLGGRLADRSPSFTLLAAIVGVTGVYTTLIPRFGPGVSNALAASDALGEKAGPFAAATAIFFLPCFLLAMVSPFAVKLHAQSLRSVGGAAGKLYALSTIGSIIGTLLTAFLFVPLWFTSSVLLGFGLALIAAAVGCLLLFRSGQGGLTGGERTGATVLGLVALCLLEWGLLSVPQTQLPDYERLLYRKDSSYHEIMVTEEVFSRFQNETGKLADPQRVVRWLKFNENLESAIYPYRDKYENAVHYTNLLHLATLWVPDPKNVLVVGGGGGVISTQFHDHYPTSDVDVAEIDPVVADVCKKYFFAKEDDRLRYIVGDGRRTLRRSAKKYDIVILDAYTSGGQIPFHLMTWEFYKEIRERLTDRGVVLSNLITAVKNHPNEKTRPADLLWALLRTAKTPAVEVNRALPPAPENLAPLFTQTYAFRRSPSDHEQNYDNVIVAMTREEKRLTREEIRERAVRLTEGENPVVKISARIFRRHADSLYEDITDEELRSVPILCDDHAPADSMYRPIKRERRHYAAQ